MGNWTQPALANLCRTLANLYPMMVDGVRLADAAGLSRAQIEFSGKAINNWHSILQRAENEKKVDRLLDIAIAENPGDDTLQTAKTIGPPPVLEGPHTKWANQAPSLYLEKILGERSTLVPINYLELGVKKARSVARVKRSDGSSGTGFLIANGLLITNNHVLPDKEAAHESVVQFNYQKTIDGLDAPTSEYRMSPEDYFKTSVTDDWSVARIKGDTSEWGHIPMKPVATKKGDYVNIIQHAGGAQKQISFTANVVAFSGGGRIQYLTDTLPGSSGSPVFDVNWSLIALHHSGGWLTEPSSTGKRTYYRNEGIDINRIISGLEPDWIIQDEFSR